MQHKALSFRGEQSPSHFENCTPTKVNTHSHKLNVFLLGEHPHAFNSRSIFDKRYLLWTIFYIYLSSGENCAQSSLWRSQSPASATCHQAQAHSPPETLHFQRNHRRFFLLHPSFDNTTNSSKMQTYNQNCFGWYHNMYTWSFFDESQILILSTL